MVVFQAPGNPAPLRTLLVTVPEGQLLAAANEDCHCAPTPMQLLGFPIHGIVASLSSDGKAMTLDMDSVPGVLDAGRHPFAVEPETWADLRPGNEYLARIFRRDGVWHLFDARLMERTE